MYATIAVDIKKGQIVPSEPAKIPENGHALLVILDKSNKPRDWKQVRRHLGWLKLRTDPAAWQKRVRDEWMHRS